MAKKDLNWTKKGTQITNDDLIELAEKIGLTVVHTNDGPPAYYRHEAATIYTRTGQSNAQARSTLAHELGHAYHQDTPSNNEVLRNRQERQADDFACKLLISPAEWALAEEIHNAHPGAIADELEITRALALHYIDYLARTPRDRWQQRFT